MSTNKLICCSCVCITSYVISEASKNNQIHLSQLVTHHSSFVITQVILRHWLLHHRHSHQHMHDAEWKVWRELCQRGTTINSHLCRSIRGWNLICEIWYKSRWLCQSIWTTNGIGEWAWGTMFVSQWCILFLIAPIVYIRCCSNLYLNYWILLFADESFREANENIHGIFGFFRWWCTTREWVCDYWCVYRYPWRGGGTCRLGHSTHCHYMSHHCMPHWLHYCSVLLRCCQLLCVLLCMLLQGG